jgi:hypothetical protein
MLTIRTIIKHNGSQLKSALVPLSEAKTEEYIKKFCMDWNIKALSDSGWTVTNEPNTERRTISVDYEAEEEPFAIIFTKKKL